MNRHIKRIVDDLRRFFPGISWRLLEDLIEYSGLVHEKYCLPKDIRWLIVIDRAVLVEDVRLEPGVYDADALPKPLTQSGTRSIIPCPPHQNAYALHIAPSTLRNVASLSPTLERSLRHFLPDYQPTTEHIFLAVAADVATSTTEFACRLAAALRSVNESHQSPCEVSVIAVTDEVDHSLTADVSAESAGTGIKYVIYHRPDAPCSPPAWLGYLRETPIHRLVYVSTRASATPPPGLLPSPRHSARPTLLNPALIVPSDPNASEPLFGSYIPTVLTPPPDRRVLPMRTVPYCRDGYTRPDVHDDCDVRDGHQRADYRFNRDMSLLSSELVECADGATRASCTFDEHEVLRWARNVANRRIGLAISGGGASAYRAVPVIKSMLDHGLDIDVLAGVSGGALIGAYFAALGKVGLELAVRRGPRFSLLALAAQVSLEPFEAQIDQDLNYGRISNASVRYIPVTLELKPDAAPLPHVIVDSSFGQAVRASGSIPGVWAPSEIDGKRYTDGGAAALVPANYTTTGGADIVLSCNCVAGPSVANPLHNIPVVGGLLYKLLGRLIDGPTWTAYLMGSATSAFASRSDVFFEFDSTRFPLEETLRWGHAQSIVASASCESARIDHAVEQLKYTWNQLA